MTVLFDQAFNKKAPEVTGKPFGMIRDVDQVWAFEPLEGKFGKHNTLVLETDEVSVHDCWKNSMILDRYERSDVWPTAQEDVRDQIEVLRTVKQDLFKVFDECSDDIQGFLKNAEGWSEYSRPAKQVSEAVADLA